MSCRGLRVLSLPLCCAQAVNNWFLHKSAAEMWIYFLGPFAGSLLGAGAFTLLHHHRDPIDYEQLDVPSFY